MGLRLILRLLFRSSSRDLQADGALGIAGLDPSLTFLLRNRLEIEESKADCVADRKKRGGGCVNAVVLQF